MRAGEAALSKDEFCRRFVAALTAEAIDGLGIADLMDKSGRVVVMPIAQYAAAIAPTYWLEGGGPWASPEEAAREELRALEAPESTDAA